MYYGKLIQLRRLELDDAKIIFPHWNNYELRQYLPTPLPTSFEDLENLIISTNKAYINRKAFTFGIETLDTKTLIGLINLENISWISRNATIGIFGIFDQNYLGHGYGADAIIVLLDFAFSVIDIHNVYLWVEAFNKRAVNFYKRIGFKDQGTLRELAFRNGERCDVVIMDILKPEFIDKYGILPKSGVI